MEIRVDGVTFSYNSVPALDGVRFTLKKGDILSVLGPNGSGKTTLLKILASVLSPKRGTVLVDGKDLAKIGINEKAKIFGYVPQRSETFNILVFEAVLSGRKPHIGFRIKKEDLEVVEEVLEVMGLSGLKSRPITKISGGEFQKVIIARALAQKPKILLLDEPLSHLDLKNQLEIASLIEKATKELGLITVLVLHDVNLALRHSNLFLLLKDGRIEAFGGRETITTENIMRVFGVLVEIREMEGFPYVFVKDSQKGEGK